MLISASPDTYDWQMTQGELIHFNNPRLSLPPIDQLEGFRPRMLSQYRRVLVPILVNSGESMLAWCYVA